VKIVEKSYSQAEKACRSWTTGVEPNPSTGELIRPKKPMKSKLLLVLFGLLVAVMLSSVFFGYQGITRLRQNQYPPFLPTGMAFTGAGTIHHPNDDVILYLDSKEGKILVGFLTVAIPAVCGVLIGKNKRQLWSFAVLVCFTAIYSWTGFSIYFHAVYDSISP
jgi:hypothetical protein